MRGIKSLLLVVLLAVVSCSDQTIKSNPQATPTNVTSQGMNADAYNNRGLAKGQSGDYQGAIADYNEAIRLKPDNVEAYTNRGTAKEKSGDYQGAIADYNEAIRLKPDLVIAYNNRGISKEKSGDLKGAIADYNEAIRLKT